LVQAAAVFQPNGLAIRPCTTPRTGITGRTGTIEPTRCREENRNDVTSWRL
jgi:hypothetical protein